MKIVFFPVFAVPIILLYDMALLGIVNLDAYVTCHLHNAFMWFFLLSWLATYVVVEFDINPKYFWLLAIVSLSFIRVKDDDYAYTYYSAV